MPKRNTRARPTKLTCRSGRFERRDAMANREFGRCICIDGAHSRCHSMSLEMRTSKRCCVKKGEKRATPKEEKKTVKESRNQLRRNARRVPSAPATLCWDRQLAYPFATCMIFP